MTIYDKLKINLTILHKSGLVNSWNYAMNSNSGCNAWRQQHRSD